MRYSAPDKTEIIRLVEQSPSPARRTLEKLGIPRSTFYRWYDRYRRGGPEALADRPSRPDRVWNRIPEAIRSQIVELALDQLELSPRELAVRFTDEEKYFVSEASVYRLLKAHDLIASRPTSSSKRPRNSGTRPRRPTSPGKPTSLTSRLRAGAGTISPPCSTTSRASLSPGSSAPR
jgi:transposase-like protein